MHSANFSIATSYGKTSLCVQVHWLLSYPDRKCWLYINTLTFGVGRLFLHKSFPYTALVSFSFRRSTLISCIIHENSKWTSSFLCASSFLVETLEYIACQRHLTLRMGTDWISAITITNYSSLPPRAQPEILTKYIEPLNPPMPLNLFLSYLHLDNFSVYLMYLSKFYSRKHLSLLLACTAPT